MKIVVIADTHVRIVDEIPTAIMKALANVDLIIHAGDYTQKAVLDGLLSIGEVKTVYGNMDPEELKTNLPEKEIFEVSGKKIGLIHGWGTPWGIAERVRRQFSNVDIIVFGHSHEPCNRYVQGVLLVNPGQARSSFGLLTVDDGIKFDIFTV